MLLAPAKVKGVKKPPTLINYHAYLSRLAWNPEKKLNVVLIINNVIY